MRANKVDLCLRDGAHADLVKRAGEEGGKGTAEHDIPVPTAQPDSHTNDILLCDEALDVTLVEGVLVGEGEGGVLGVAIKSHYTIKVLSELDQGISVHLAGGSL